MNAIQTDMTGRLKGMFVADGTCHLFASAASSIRWYTFSASKSYMDILLSNKHASVGTYAYSPTLQ